MAGQDEATGTTGATQDASSDQHEEQHEERRTSYRITAPNGFSGQGAGGVRFRDGVAETENPGVAAYYARKRWPVDGYGVDEAPALPLDGGEPSVGPIVHPPGADPGPNGQEPDDGVTRATRDDDEDDQEDEAPAKPAGRRSSSSRKATGSS